MMKVIKSEQDILEFDNGVRIEGEGDIDCCAQNFLDFEQIPVGTDFPTMSIGELVDSVNLKKDGFAITDSIGIPKWVQARSMQNGYYSNMTTVFVKQGDKSINLGSLAGPVEDES